MKRTEAGATHAVGGVSVTVDSLLRLTRGQIDEASIVSSFTGFLKNPAASMFNNG